MRETAIYWTCEVACPNCGELFNEERLGQRGADTASWAFEGARWKLDAHAAEDGCDLTCGVIEFNVEAVRP